MAKITGLILLTILCAALTHAYTSTAFCEIVALETENICAANCSAACGVCGVTCNVGLNIIGLDVSSTGLSSLPDSLCTLTYLVTLNVGNNSLTSLPGCLGLLSALTSLDAHGNELTDLPISMLRLMSLDHLFINANQFTILPVWLGYINTLVHLEFECNYIKTIPLTFAGLTALTTVRLDGNFLSCAYLPEGIFRTSCQQACQYTAPALVIPTSSDSSALVVLDSVAPGFPQEDPVVLGTAGNYAILAKSGISVTPASTAPVVIGDIAVSPAAATYITYFDLIYTPPYATSAKVTGRVYAANYAEPTPTLLTAAVSAMEAAYTDAAGRAPDVTELGSGGIGGLTLAPGVYKWSNNVLIATDLTLAGSGSDVWIFEIAGTLTVSNGVEIILFAGALAKNVFWQVALSVTIGTTVQFKGTILCLTNIQVQTGAVVSGRLLAQTAVTLDYNTIDSNMPNATLPIVPYNGTYYTGAFICDPLLPGGDICNVLECSNLVPDCRDGDFCSGLQCDPILGCTYTPPACLDDDNECTNDFCNATTGNCTHVPIPNCVPQSESEELESESESELVPVLSTIALVGIILGSIVAGLLIVALISACIWAVACNRRKRRSHKYVQTSSYMKTSGHTY